jgi:hypothetical protein
MHPFASAAAGARAIPRTAVQRISDFMVYLLQKHSAQQSGFEYLVPGNICDEIAATHESGGESAAGPGRRYSGRCGENSPAMYCFGVALSLSAHATC